MLREIRLEHFQKHRSFSHKFSEGLTVCCGGNWSGKSSLLRAILYALFGTSAVPVKAGNLATRGEKSFLVELEFAVSGQDYRIERGKTKAVLYKGQELLASGQTQVTQAVEDVLGVSAKNFLSFNTAQQDEAGALLSLGAQKLGQHLADITGVTLVDDVIERAKERTAPLRGYKERLESLLTELEEARGQAESFRARHLRAEASLTEAAKLRETAEEGKQAALQHAQAVDRGYKAYQEFLKKEEALTQSIRITEQRLQEAQARLFTPEHSINELYEQLQALEKQNTAAFDDARQRAELFKAILTAQEAIQGLEFKLEGIADFGDFKELELKTREAYVSLAEKEALLRTSEDSIKNMVCHACNRPFDGADLSRTKEQITALREELPALKRAYESKRAAYDAALAASEEKSNLQSSLKSWKDYCERASEAYQKCLVSPVKSVAPEALSQARSAYEQAAAAQARADEAKRVYEQESGALTTYQQRLKELGSCPTVLEDEVAEAAERVRGAYDTFAQANNTEIARLHERNQALQDLRRAEGEVHRLSGECDHCRNNAQKLDRLSRLMKYLKTNRDRFMGQTWESLLGYASEFVSEATSGDISGIARSESGEFVYVETGQEMPVELASGMQRAILGVAVKLAMSSALGGGFNVLLLDEISAAASDENSLILTDLLARTGQQTFLITHRQADAAAAQSVLELT
jgi:exonuclease SbcC